MNPYEYKYLLWLFLLIPFALVLGTGIFFIGLGIRYSRIRKRFEKPLLKHSERAFRPVLFEQPCHWVAVKTNNLSAVQEVLGLSNPVPCTWPEALQDIRDHKLFIAPPFNGWILILGSELPDASEDVDKCFCFLMELSRQLGQVHYYITNRVLNHHGWAQLNAGKVLRGYLWAGGTEWNQGKMTSAEVQVGMRCFAYGTEPAGLGGQFSSEVCSSNCDKVVALASRWSFDPNTIADEIWTRAQGVLGEIKQSKFH